MCKTYFYMRISTQEERGKQKYIRQENALKKYAEQNNIDFDEHYIYKEDVSGKSFVNRKEWQKLEKDLQDGDTVIFKDICRFTREAENGYEKYMELMGKGVNLYFIDSPTCNTDYIKNLLNIADTQDLIAKESTKFIAKIILIAELDRAEKERLNISKRTKDGIAARKAAAEANGETFHCGREKGKLDKMSDDLKGDIAKYLSDRSIKGIDLMNKYHISRNTFKKYCAIVKESM